MTENELIKKIAIAKAKPDTLTDISPRDLADLVLVVLQYAKEINKQITEGRIKGDKGDIPIPDVDYLSLPTAKAELDKLQSQTISRILSDAQNALSRVRNGKDGMDGKDGKNAVVTEEQIKEASRLAFEMIDLPDFRVLITEQPEAIRDSLELLQDDERLDVSAIKGLDELLSKYKGKTEMVVGGIRFLSQLADVYTTSLANNDVLKWNSTTLRWENGAVSGGVSDGDKGDITVSGSGATWTIDAGLDAIKIADGTVSNTEFQYLNGVTSAIQTQLDAKQDDITGADTRILFFDGANNPAGDAGLTYNKASDTLTIAGGLAVDTNTLFVDSTNNRVGINTASPSTALQAVDTSSGTTSFKFDFLGWNGAAYTTGLALNSTDASGYYPNHIKLTNAAYGTNGTIFTANNNGIYYSSDTGSVKHIFRDVTHSVGTFSTVASEPTLSVSNTPAADKIGIAVTAHASQTASLQEWQNSSGTPLSKVKSNGDIEVPDEAYGAGWNGSLEVPTKNALYDKIETLGGGSGITRTVVTTSGSLTLGATASVDYVYYVAGAHTLSMPSPNTNRYTIKNLHSAAITVDTAGAETIEGGASLSLQPNDSIDVLSDGTNWYVH